MRRYLLAAALLLVLGMFAFTQRINANPQGNNQNYSPIVYGAALTPTPEPTATAAPTETPTNTPVPEGTGVYKKQRSTLYGPLDYKNIYACGFVRFYDGTPAYGGPDGFSAEACLDATGRCGYLSPPVDASGYYEIPIESFRDLPDNGGGTIYVTQGRDRDRVSQGTRWDFRDVPDGDNVLGVVVRMDFIECRVGDTSNQCQLDASAYNEDGVALVPAPVTEMSPQSPNNYCPEFPAPTATPTP